MTKVELEAEVKELRSKVAQLEARLLIAEQQRMPVVLPGPVYPTYPNWWNPYPWPQIWCGTTTATNSISCGPQHDENGKYIGPVTFSMASDG